MFSVPERKKIFISYSHADKKYLNRLRVFLTDLARDGYLESWDDSRIRVGANWQKEIKEALDSAAVAVLLISQDFLASDFISSVELPTILASVKIKGTRIIPIHVKPSSNGSLKRSQLEEFQAFNSPLRPVQKMSNYEQEFFWASVADEIENVISSPPAYTTAVDTTLTDDESVDEISNLKESPEEIKLFRLVVARNPTLVDGWIHLALSLFKAKTWDDALYACDRVLGFDPNNPAYWNMKGVILRNLLRFEESLSSYDRALALDGSFAEAWSNKAHLLRNLKRLNEALACAIEATSFNPNLMDAWNNKSVILNDLEQFSAGLEAAENALQINPKFVIALNNKSISLRHLKRFDEAFATLSLATTIEPRSADVWCTKGSIHIDKKEWDEALESYNRALEIDPSHSIALLNKGIALQLKRQG